MIQFRRRRPRGLGRFERDVLDLASRAAGNAAHAATLLCEIFDRWDERARIAEQIKAAERTGDEITHQIFDALHRSRLQPADRGDLHALASAIDDITDLVEEVADLIGLYRIEAPMDQAVDLAGIIRDGARAVARATAEVPNSPLVAPELDRIRDLEHEGDAVVRRGLSALFDAGIDPMAVIRWKDLFGRLEDGADACKHAGDAIATLVARHS